MANNDDATDGATDFETDPTACVKPFTEPRADWDGALFVIKTSTAPDNT